MKHRLILLISVAVMALVGCVKQEDIENMNQQMDSLEKNEIATIQSQVASINSTIESLKKIDTELSGYVDDLDKELAGLQEAQEGQEDEIDAIKKEIDGLQEAQGSLREEMTALETYVETQLKGHKDWANATLATLEQYNYLCDLVAKLDVRIDKCGTDLSSIEASVTEAYKKAIKEAVAACEEKMKQWVNEQLTGYYTIAKASAALGDLETKITDADAALQKQIDEHADAIDEAKTLLTLDYCAAIKEAINELDGKIDTELQTKITAMNTEIGDKIDKINEEITSIKARLEKVEAVIDQIQSIVAIPDNADGSLNIGVSASEELRFDVKPLAAIDSLLAAGKTDIFTFKVIKTRTKANVEPSMTVVGAKLNDDDELVLTVDASGLGDEFKDGAQALSASLVIKSEDGVTAKSSDYFAMKYYYVAPKPLLTGKFSVSATKQVQFTRGNLYWDGTAWGLEAAQTDYPTAWSTEHVSHLFWTKDAANSYAASYNESASAATTDKFFADGSDADHSLTIEGQSDLYALSSAEWTYLISTRTSASGLYKYGVTVTNGGTSYTNCLIIAPDDFTGTLEASYTLDEVNASGLVCLPAAGYRDGSELYAAGSYGYCWSATPSGDDESSAYSLYFEDINVTASDYYNRYFGFSVRLVCAVPVAGNTPGLTDDNDSYNF